MTLDEYIESPMAEPYPAVGATASVGIRIFARAKLRRELTGHPDQVEARADAELRVDVGQVRLDGSLADEQALADLASRPAVDGQPGDLTLARAEGGHTGAGDDDAFARMTKLLQGQDRAFATTFGAARGEDGQRFLQGVHGGDAISKRQAAAENIEGAGVKGKVAAAPQDGDRSARGFDAASVAREQIGPRVRDRGDRRVERGFEDAGELLRVVGGTPAEALIAELTGDLRKVQENVGRVRECTVTRHPCNRPLAALRCRWKVTLRARDQSRQPVDVVAVAEDRVTLEDPRDECQVFLRLGDEPELDDGERGQPQAPRPAGADASRVPGGGLEPAFVRALEVAG